MLSLNRHFIFTHQALRSILAVFFFLLVPGTLFAADPAVAAANADRFGLLTLLPPLVAITLAFITRNVVISLFMGYFPALLCCP